MRGEGRNVSASQGPCCESQGTWAGADLLALTAQLWLRPKRNVENQAHKNPSENTLLNEFRHPHEDPGNLCFGVRQIMLRIRAFLYWFIILDKFLNAYQKTFILGIKIKNFFKRLKKSLSIKTGIIILASWCCVMMNRERECGLWDQTSVVQVPALPLAARVPLGALDTCSVPSVLVCKVGRKVAPSSWN